MNKKFVLSILSSLPLLACAVGGLELPSITDSATGLRSGGKVVWRDLITHTPDASRRFYEQLFGWEFETVPVRIGTGDAAYSLIRHRGELIGGMVDANALGRENPAALSQWIVAMSVPDVDAAAAQVAASGGRVLTAPTDVAARGRAALVEDSEGAALALLESRDGDPVDRTAEGGGFLWDELWADDVARATTFYLGLAGFDAQTVPIDDGTSYRYLSASGVPRAGILANPAPGFEPTWVSYVRTADPGTVAERVAGLGGRVLVPAQPRAIGGEVALIADPSGAGLALQSWSPEAGQ